MEITQDGSLMFVSNYCDKSISLIDLSDNKQQVLSTRISLDSKGANPLDLTSFKVEDNYTDLFVSKENFKGRNAACATPITTAGTLYMDLLSIQEQPDNLEEVLDNVDVTDNITDDPEDSPTNEIKRVPFFVQIWRLILSIFKK